MSENRNKYGVRCDGSASPKSHAEAMGRKSSGLRKGSTDQPPQHVTRTFYHVLDDSDPKKVKCRPMDPFAAAAAEKEYLQYWSDWMDAEDRGLSIEAAKAEANRLRDERRIKKQGGAA